jgi:hypothetical protein
VTPGTPITTGRAMTATKALVRGQVALRMVGMMSENNDDGNDCTDPRPVSRRSRSSYASNVEAEIA